MKPKSKLLWIPGLASCLVLAGFLVAQQPERKAAEKVPRAAAPLGVAGETGGAVLRLGKEAQERLGVVVEPLEAVSTRSQAEAAALVLPADELVRLRASYVAAEVKLEQAQARAAVAEQEYKRLEQLYSGNQNASLKAVEAAQGDWRASRAAEHAAHQEVALARLAAQQRWGDVVAGWVARDAPELERVLAGRTMLVQVTLAPGADFVHPARIRLQTPGGRLFHARVVSLFPRTDPRIQGASLLYRAPARPEIAPGITLAALLPQGSVLRGTLIPASAVVWKDGRAWAYVETTAGQFARRAVETDFPMKGGYFARNFAPGEKIVARGAEALVSAEAGPPRPAGKSDED
jgi:hypothetical protein